MLVINLAIDEENKSLHFDMKFGNTSSATYHFLDTDSNGVIRKHVKVRGIGGKEEVILDNYKLQGTLSRNW